MYCNLLWVVGWGIGLATCFFAEITRAVFSQLRSTTRLYHK